MNLKAAEKGSITVEAAIMLPLFIIAIMVFAFILKVYYVNEIVQNAITGASRQMSVYSLIYYKTNAEEVLGSLEKFSSSDTVSNTLGDNVLTSIIQEAGKEANDYVRAQLALVPAAKLIIRNQLQTENYKDIDKRLSGLNIAEGFNGFDFSDCKMLADGRSIDITVSYTMKFPFLSELLPGIKLKQTASACIWAGEEGVGNSIGDEEDNVSVWDMTNLKRGQEIRKRQGANLPFNFPTIAKFENGTATSIKSLNIDEPYYKNALNLEKKITGYINKLEEFEGGTGGGVSINSWEISNKVLILVIPETELTHVQQSVLDKCISAAKSKGITLKPVKAYGRMGQGGNQSNEKNTDKGNIGENIKDTEE
mgnify:CR=1 FL=1